MCYIKPTDMAPFTKICQGYSIFKFNVFSFFSFQCPWSNNRKSWKRVDFVIFFRYFRLKVFKDVSHVLKNKLFNGSPFKTLKSQNFLSFLLIRPIPKNEIPIRITLENEFFSISMNFNFEINYNVWRVCAVCPIGEAGHIAYNRCCS